MEENKNYLNGIAQYRHLNCASPLSTTTTKSTSDYDDDELQLKFGMRPKDENKSKLHQLIIDKDKEIASKIYALTLDKNKSPLTILNEMMTFLNKSSVVYSLVAVSGKLHNQWFTMKAKCDDMIAYGYGTSKKIAKTCSANNFLKKISPNYDITTSLMEKTLSNLMRDNHIEEYTENLLNPINTLQELCVSNYWEIPKYTYNVKISGCQQIQFEVTCTHQILSFKGVGKSKKEAKRHAALLMYNQLKLNLK